MKNAKNAVIAGVVIYNPDILLLEKNIDAILKQIPEIVIIDNNSQNEKEVNQWIEKYDTKSVEIIHNKENKGIAYALNQILKYGSDKGFDWVLTMDQDSILMPGIVEKYLQYAGMDNIGMISSEFIDRQSNVKRNIKAEEFEFVDKCITSGCLTNVAACLKLGGFDDAMFIDYVDFDMCVRLRKAEYKILRVNTIGISHTIGRAEPLKILGKQVIICGNPVEIYNESPIRVFYFFRNVVYFLRKHGKWSRGYTSWIHIIWRAFIVVFFEKPKNEKMKMIMKGIKEGFKMEV